MAATILIGMAAPIDTTLRIATILAILCLLCACASNHPVDDRIRGTATLSRIDGNTVSVLYRLDRPVSALVFAVGAPFREAAWHAEGGRVRKQSVHFDMPRVSVRLDIEADPRMYDRVNPGMYDLGHGVLLHADYLELDASLFDIRFHIDAPGQVLVTDDIVQPLSARFDWLEPGGFTYLGDAAGLTEHGRITIVASQNVSLPLREIIADRFTRAADYFADRLSSSARHAPRLFVLVSKGDGRNHRGTAFNSAIALHLQGDAWQDPDAELVARLEQLAFHEMFHLYQGSLFVPAGEYDNHRAAWVSEGAADYFAAELDESGQPPMQRLFGQCAEQLGSRPLIADGRGRQGKAPYQCGHFLHRTMVALTGKPDGLAEVWRHITDPDGTHGVKWTPDEYLAVVRGFPGGERFSDLASMILHHDGIERWHSVAAIISMEIEPIEVLHEEVAMAEGKRLISELLGRHCRGRNGFWSQPGSITLDAPDCGGGLVDKAVIVGVESLPFNSPSAWIERFRNRCESGEAVRLSVDDGTTLTVDCTTN